MSEALYLLHGAAHLGACVLITVAVYRGTLRLLDRITPRRR